MRTYTAIEVAELLPEGAIDKVNAWIARGDGIAVYTNEAFDRSDFGSIKFMSFGSDAAQFVVPPDQLPDFPGEINWAFRLTGTYRGERQLVPAAAHDFADPYLVLPFILGGFDNRDLAYLDSRLIAYTLEVGYQPDGAANFNMYIRAEYTPRIDGECAEIRLTAPTHDGRVDRLGPWSWYIRNMKLAQSNLVDGQALTGSDPNLGGAIVSICNLSAKKPGEGS